MTLCTQQKKVKASKEIEKKLIWQGMSAQDSRGTSLAFSKLLDTVAQAAQKVSVNRNISYEDALLEVTKTVSKDQE